MTTSLVRRLSVFCLVLAAAGSVAHAASPEEVFKANGLTKVGFLLVTAQEAEIHAAANTVRGLKQRVSSETLARANMARAVQTATDIVVNLNSQLISLTAKLNALKKKPEQYNQLVDPYNETLRQYKIRKVSLEALQKKLGQIADSQIPYGDAAIAGSKKADAAVSVYAALAQDAALKAAIDAYNKTAPQALKLGPSGNFSSDVAFLKKCVDDMAAEGVPVRMEHGVPVVEVIINGVKHDMIWDSGASTVSLSAETAAELGLHATASDRTVDMTVADGRTVHNKLIVVPLIRVGVFSAENVECVIAPRGPVRGPDLLGGAFQHHFLCRLDSVAGVLHLTPNDKQASEDPSSVAPASPNPAPKPAPSSAAKPHG